MTMRKIAFVESLPTLAGLSVGYGPGRSVAGETASAIAPQGRAHRSENMARNAAVIGAPLGGLIAMGLARKYHLANKLKGFVGHNFPEGLIAEPEIEKELVHLGVPGVAAITGSLAGGGITGGLIGGAQALRGPTHHREKVSSADVDMGHVLRILTKIAGQDQNGSEKRRRAVNAYGALAAGQGSGMLLNESAPRITGRTALYHGTSEKNLPSVIEQGVLPGASGGKRGVSDIIDGEAGVKTKQLGFLTNHKPTARNYAEQSERLAPLLEAKSSPNEIRMALNGIQRDPGIQSRAANPFNNKGVVSASVPMWKKEIADKVRVNPEIEVMNKKLEDPMFRLMNPGVTREAIQQHLGDKVVALEGGLDPKYIKGSKTYQRLGLSEIGEYAKARPGRFMGGLGLGAAGLAAGGLALHQARKALTPSNPKVASLAKVADDGGQGGFAPNEYSGVMNPLPMVYKSGIPPWKEPQVKKASGLSQLEREEVAFDPSKYAKPVVGIAEDLRPLIQQRLRRRGGDEKTAAAPTAPLGHLNASKSVGTPKVTAPPGPSIAQISKPKGYGMPMSGAKKGNNTI